MSRLSISTAWEDTKKTVAADGTLILTVALALIVLPHVVAGLVSPPTGVAREQSGVTGLVVWIALLVGIVGQLAVIRLALGPTTVGEAISRSVKRLLPALGALILFGIAVALLLVPLVIVLALTGAIDVSGASARPGGLGGLLLVMVLIVVAILPRFLLIMPVASAEQSGPIAILRRSWGLSAGQYWRLLAFAILIAIMAFILLVTAQLIGGVIAQLMLREVEPMSLAALLLALFVAVAQGAFAIISSLMLARIYLQLAGARGPEVTVPHSGT